MVRTFAPPSAGRPADLAAGSDGAIWFTAMAGPGSDDGGEEAADPAAGRSAVTRKKDDGAQAGGGAQGVIGRIGRDGRITETGIGAGNQPGAITTGPDGAVWFTLKGRAALGRLDGAGAFSTLTLPAGGAAVDVATGPDGGLWYTAQGPDRIGRVALDATDGGDPTLAAGTGPLGTVPPGPALPADGPAGTPDLGQSVVVAASNGTVKVRTPGSGRYVALDASGGEVPVGSVLDARHGTVRLRTALGAGGRTQDGNFRGAMFEVRQPGGHEGLTELVLKGGSFAGCAPASHGGVAGLRASTARRRHAVRSLWGSDNGGRFRTRGRDSVATVRGTYWRTTDRCDGTLTTRPSAARSPSATAARAAPSSCGRGTRTSPAMRAERARRGGGGRRASLGLLIAVLVGVATGLVVTRGPRPAPARGRHGRPALRPPGSPVAWGPRRRLRWTPRPSTSSRCSGPSCAPCTPGPSTPCAGPARGGSSTTSSSPSHGAPARTTR